jgi:FkbM family methyltransferase
MAGETTLSKPAVRSVLAPLLKANGIDLGLNMLNIGARPIEGTETEPFWELLDLFPASSIAAVELESKLCDELNLKAPERVRYYATAIGRTEERRAIYETAHPMCTSLYRTDERYVDLYHGLDVMRVKNIAEVSTVSLDKFVSDNRLGSIDFLKIDIQGAELDVFLGGAQTMREMLLVVTEVEFVPLYLKQPLFGDVAACMRDNGMMFHKFLGMEGRVMKPLKQNGSKHYPAQYMWSDAIFMRDLFDLQALSIERLLKLAVLLDIYNSRDAALHVLRHYDVKAGDDLSEIYFTHVTQDIAWN